MSTARTERPNALRTGWFLLWASALAIGAVALLATATHQPWVFPSLGPTAYLVLALPLAAGSSPRNAVCGHAIGIASGAVAVALLGLWNTPADLEDVDPARTIAVVIALALTLALMTWLGVAHAPAAATTLIVALGLLYTVEHFVLMMVSVVVLLVVAHAITRLRGQRPPIWAPRPSDRPAD